MYGSSFGKCFKITTFGESHGECIGVTIDGVPAGLSLSSEDFLSAMERRKASDSEVSTKRHEEDSVKIVSGVFNDTTIGTPITLLIGNNDVMSSDYDSLKNIYRPGHADYTYDAKYGIRDYRGGGRASGRETAARVAAGVVAGKILNLVNIGTSVSFVYPESIPEGDSVGGIVTCTLSNVPAGLGEPVFDKADALLAHAVMSTGSVKAIEFGEGLKVCDMTGSEFNDPMLVENGRISFAANNSGGILGGITTGQDIVIKAYIKPTPSIETVQDTVTCQKEAVKLSVKGRHDKCIVPRVAPVIEAMCKITIADMLLSNVTSKADNILKIYNEKQSD